MIILTSQEEELIKKVSNLTSTFYEVKKYNDKLYIDEQSLLTMIDELCGIIEYKDEELEDLKKDLEDNYRPIPISEQIE